MSGFQPMRLLNDEQSVSVLEGGALAWSTFRLSRRTMQNASRRISDVDEAVLPVRQQGLAGSHTGTVVVETEDMT